ncbi:hypothetical protein OFO30_38320, partial [Escherichia coli]|nr:hypothetical protein [Escherichia coli]
GLAPKVPRYCCSGKSFIIMQMKIIESNSGKNTLSLVCLLGIALFAYIISPYQLIIFAKKI